MKIGPLPPQAPTARPPSPAGPSRPFEDFLDTAYAFTELGMFGHGRGKASEPEPRSGPCRGPAPAEQAAALPTASPGEAAPEPTMIPHARAFSAHPARDAAHPAGKRTPPAARSKGQLPAGELPAPERAADEAGPDAPAAARRTVRRLPPPRSAVSLIVTEKDGRVELVAAAPKLDPETRAALRRLVRDILARSGLALAHFQLNGAPVAPDSLDSTGGSHGTRSG